MSYWISQLFLIHFIIDFIETIGISISCVLEESAHPNKSMCFTILLNRILLCPKWRADSAQTSYWFLLLDLIECRILLRMRLNLLQLFFLFGFARITNKLRMR